MFYFVLFISSAYKMTVLISDILNRSTIGGSRYPLFGNLMEFKIIALLFKIFSSALEKSLVQRLNGLPTNELIILTF